SVEVVPNAILALGREHYRGTSPDWRDARQMATYRGLHRLAAKYWRTGVSELIRSKLRALYARSAAELVPGTRASELLTGGSGVRAQAVARDGTLMDDFVFLTGPRSLHVLNAPSPAATASLAIGRSIAGRALSELNGG
ncbi:MAG: L-2-hydroxyglutarate oxidase, partial [Acidimicrobiia bacterium]|nr:L-2-hydroxyglutarate oxidase [Acidimicrobiia bacterium]